jgi:prolyl-tRNA synthetase
MAHSPKLIESYPNRAVIIRSLSNTSHITSASTSMATLESITQSLAGLAITPSASVTHAETNSPASWREALLATPSAPASFELIKTLVYKPKTAKSATPVPVVVIAREETETSSSALGKKLNLKELRLASEDLLSDFFALDKNSRMLSLMVRCN